MKSTALTSRVGSGLKRKAVQGLSLIELMISMVIGLVIVGGLIAMYSNTLGSTAVAKAQSEMNEDAQYILRVLSHQIQQAGYNPIQRGRSTVNTLIGGFGVFACSNGFSNATSAANASALTCNAAAAAGGHGLAIAYEADIRNTKATSGSLPTNCLGNALVQQTDASSGDTYYVAENRYYVKNNALYCAGTETTIQEQPLADNVEKLEVSLGTAHPTNGTKFVAGYLTPTEIGPATVAGGTVGVDPNLVALTPEQRWGKVVTVRICVIMRSDKEVLTEATDYYGCDSSAASTVTPGDRRLYRAYVRTIAIRNRMASAS